MKTKMSEKELNDRIGDVKNSNVSVETKQILVNVFNEIYTKCIYESCDYSFNGYCDGKDYLVNIPIWLQEVLHIKIQRKYSDTSHKIWYDVSIPSTLVIFNIDSELRAIEKKEKEISIISKKRNSIAKSMSLTELRELKSDLINKLEELNDEIKIISMAIDIKEEIEHEPKEKSYKKNK